MYHIVNNIINEKSIDLSMKKSNYGKYFKIR